MTCVDHRVVRESIEPCLYGTVQFRERTHSQVRPADGALKKSVPRENHSIALAVETDAPGRVPRRVQHCKREIPDIYLLAVLQETVRLRFSDDQGNTYTDAGTLTLTPANFVENMQWLSLGQLNAPGRVYEITDTGAVQRLDGADAEVGEEGS